MELMGHPLDSNPTIFEQHFVKQYHIQTNNSRILLYPMSRPRRESILSKDSSALAIGLCNHQVNESRNLPVANGCHLLHLDTH